MQNKKCVVVEGVFLKFTDGSVSREKTHYALASKTQ